MNTMPITNPRSGQVLLLIVLLVTALLTVVMTISFRAARDTQLTLAQTEVSDLTFAAETAAEQAIAGRREFPDTIRPGTQLTYDTLFTTVGLTDLSFDTVDTAISTVRIEQNYIADEFRSPALDKDQQYTLYLSEYLPDTDPASGELSVLFGPAYDEDLEIAIQTEPDTRDCINVALEITVVHGTPGSYELNRFIMEESPYLVSSQNDPQVFEPARVAIGGGAFECVTTLTNAGNPDIFTDIADKRLLIARVMYQNNQSLVPTPTVELLTPTPTPVPDVDIESVILVFRPQNGGVLPPQGIDYVSRAVSVAGVEKRVTVTQSFPQIPADLFVTSF